MNLMIITVFSFLFSSTMYSAESVAAKKPMVLAIPGVNGLGATPSYIKQVFGTNIISRHASSPGFIVSGFITADLGGPMCMRTIERARQSIPVDQQIIVFGASQGAAGGIKLAANPAKNKNIVALVTEGTLASPTSAIATAVLYLTGHGFLPQSRFSRFVLPYLAKFLQFPFYSPSSQQPIERIKDIPRHIPFIIIHGEFDHETPLYDAFACYLEALRHRSAEKNVYLIYRSAGGHIYNLSSDYNGHPYHNPNHIVQRILKKHDLSDFSGEVGDLSAYQPTAEQVEKMRDTIFKENENVTLKDYVADIRSKRSIEEHRQQLLADAAQHQRIGRIANPLIRIGSLAFAYVACRFILQRTAPHLLRTPLRIPA